jgi:hypothetical protein
MSNHGSPSGSLRHHSQTNSGTHQPHCCSSFQWMRPSKQLAECCMQPCCRFSVAEGSYSRHPTMSSMLEIPPVPSHEEAYRSLVLKLHDTISTPAKVPIRKRQCGRRLEVISLEHYFIAIGTPHTFQATNIHARRHRLLIKRSRFRKA